MDKMTQTIPHLGDIFIRWVALANCYTTPHSCMPSISISGLPPGCSQSNNFYVA